MITPRQPRQTTRRRFISMTAAFAATSLFGGAASATPGTRPLHWRGLALGAEAEIIIHHPDPVLARRLITQSLDEVERLERLFSLYRSDSELITLNETGHLRRPSHDMLRLLSLARRIAKLSDGAFDVSVQPLWCLYGDHFGRAGADPAGPDASAIAAALDRVDYRAISFDADTVRLEKPGMALTFNGIAQGYITDRVADVLRRGGLGHVLTNMGEIYAAGGTGRRPWRIDSPASDGVLDVTDGAVATSEGAGTRFDVAGRHHHLLDPRNGRSAGFYEAVTVMATDAATADALSTALFVLPRDRAERVVAAVPGARAWFKELSRG